jgi:predicted PhzF superfamily epimerase YddE/YHI9
MSVAIFVVDAFADASFTGNPAGVVLLTEARPEEWMQSVAAEMKHAETAFVRKLDDGYSLRWFTPVTEVDLCGHATLASAFVLSLQGERPPYRFHTRSGVLTADCNGDDIVLDFPVETPYEVDPPSSIEEIVGESPQWFGRNRMDWFVQLSSEETVRTLEPDLIKIAALGLRGLIVTAKGESFDFVSRFFAPQAGVPEDSVTGSAHCALAPYWFQQLGTDEMRGFQASERGGIVGVKVIDERVELRGTAVLILEGTLRV